MFRQITMQSALPWDILWYLPEYAVFFGIFYFILSSISIGLGIVIIRSIFIKK